METLGAVTYFASVFAALPVFVALDLVALHRLRGWARLLPLATAAYIGWVIALELVPVLMHAGELEPSEFRRLMYERWSAVSRPALHASALMLALLAVYWRRR